MSKQFTIKAASKMTGLTPDTIRVWERRYGAVTPERQGPGVRRVYDERDVERLQLMKRATDAGHPIRMIANLSIEELEELVPQNMEIVAHGERRLVESMIEAIENYDLARFDQLLGSAVIALEPEPLITSVLFPLLREVGDLWHSGRLRVAQEHLVSQSLRNLTGGLMKSYSRTFGAPSIAFATLSGERHEFGILLCCWLSIMEGLNCVYIGPDSPPEEIAEAARRTHCAAIAISVIHVPRVAEVREQLLKLSDLVGDEIEILVGGTGAEKFSDIIAQRKNLRWVDLKAYHTTMQNLAMSA